MTRPTGGHRGGSVETAETLAAVEQVEIPAAEARAVAAAAGGVGGGVAYPPPGPTRQIPRRATSEPDAGARASTRAIRRVCEP